MEEQEMKNCPDCPDQGWCVVGHQEDPEQVQCQFCWTHPNSVFRFKENIK